MSQVSEKILGGLSKPLPQPEGGARTFVGESTGLANNWWSERQRIEQEKADAQARAEAAEAKLTALTDASAKEADELEMRAVQMAAQRTRCWAVAALGLGGGALVGFGLCSLLFGGKAQKSSPLPRTHQEVST